MVERTSVCIAIQFCVDMIIPTSLYILIFSPASTYLHTIICSPISRISITKDNINSDVGIQCYFVKNIFFTQKVPTLIFTNETQIMIMKIQNSHTITFIILVIHICFCYLFLHGSGIENTCLVIKINGSYKKNYNRIEIIRS